MVHIREYDCSGNGIMYPTKKGACFTKSRWAKFVRNLDEIDRIVELLKSNKPVDYLQHIGGKYHVSISKGIRCVNIRRYILPLNHPTIMGARTIFSRGVQTQRLGNG